MSITADRAHAYFHHYLESAKLCRTNDPLRARTFLICAYMCHYAHQAARISEADALQQVDQDNQGT